MAAVAEEALLGIVDQITTEQGLEDQAEQAAAQEHQIMGMQEPLEGLEAYWQHPRIMALAEQQEALPTIRLQDQAGMVE